MGIDGIWPLLDPDTRDWLIANNGDAVPADIAAQIDEAVEASGADDVWAPRDAAGGERPAEEDEDDEEEDDEDFDARYLSDESVDWIEEFANEVE
ncbi:hypothetical protein ACH3VR_08885 [Microbacterium sp. B2969]|uniref:DNA primase n=1 Tax=Microbacterium alkaliflavum TaxID=3248839 RepID=A0ABW7Q6K5_9MICO